MFSKGDKVVYGSTGVCEIADICEKELIRNQKRQYYVLTPLFQQNNVIYAPVDNVKVSMRPIITVGEAEELISKIPEIKEKNSERLLTVDDYRSELSSAEITDLITLTTIIYEKKRVAGANKKKLGFVDEKYMRIAESLLFGELSVVLQIPIDEVPKYIKSKIEKT